MSNTCPAKDDSAVKSRKLYVDLSKSSSKNCMIHGPVNSSDKYKVLWNFGTKYAAAQTTKDLGSNPMPQKGFQKKQENRTIIDSMVDELHMVESKTVSDVNH